MLMLGASLLAGGGLFLISQGGREPAVDDVAKSEQGRPRRSAVPRRPDERVEPTTPAQYEPVGGDVAIEVKWDRAVRQFAEFKSESALGTAIEQGVAVNPRGIALRISELDDRDTQAKAAWFAAYYWPQASFPDGEAWVMTLPKGKARDDALRGLLTRFYDHAEMGTELWDPEIARRLILNINSASEQGDRIRMMSASIEERDAAEALLWVAGFEGQVDPVIFEAKLRQAVYGWFQSGDAFLPEAEAFENYGPQLQRAISGQLSSLEIPVETKLEWLSSLSNTELRADAVKTMAQFTFGANEQRKAETDAIEEWAMAQESETIRQAALAGLVHSDIKNDAVADGLRRAALLNDPELRESSATRCVQRWSRLAFRVSEHPLNDDEGSKQRLAEARQTLRSANLPPKLTESLIREFLTWNR